MRILRIVAITAAAFVALVILAALAVLLFVDPNRYRGDIERAVQEHTSRALTIQGKLHLTVFPWLGLSVEGVQLANRPGFGADPFLTVQKASIGVKVLPLLARRVEVSRVALDAVQVNLVSRGEQNNWQDLGESPQTPHEGGSGTAAEGTPPAGKRSAGAAVGSLSIEGVDLGKSLVLYQDEVKHSTTRIANLELHTGRLAMAPDRVAVGKLELLGSYLSSTPPTAGADIQQAQPVAFSLRSPGLVLDNAAQTLAPTKVELRLGESHVEISLSGEQMSGAQRQVTGELAIPSTSPRKLLQSLAITPPTTRDSRVLSVLELRTRFRLTAKEVQLSALQMTLDDTQLQGNAAIENGETSAYSFDLTLNAINFDRYRAPAVPAAAAHGKPATPPPPTPLPLESLRKLNAHGTLRVGSATVANLLLKDLVVPLDAKDGHIRLGPTQAQLYGGSCNGDIVLDARPTQAELSLNEHVHGTDIGALVKAAYDSAVIAGHADANVAVTGAGATDAALTRSLSGKIDANVKQGALNGIDLVYELQSVNALLKRQLPPPRTGPARTVFNALQTNGTLDKGVLHVDELRIETDFLKVHGGGTLDTATEAINYQLVASVNKLQSGNPGGRAAGALDALKSVDVPLAITGTLSKPTVRPDIQALARGKLGQEVQQRAADEVKKKLGDKLKGFLGH